MPRLDLVAAKPEARGPQDEPRRAPWTGLVLVACAGFVLATAATHLVASSPVGTQGARYIAVHVALGALMLGAWAATRWAGTRAGRLVVASGILARLILVPVPAFTSGDSTRYLWDGHVALAGLDPYRFAPDDVDPRVAAGWPAPRDNRSVPTIYPPGALALFAAAAATGPVAAFWTWKVLVTAASIGTVLIVWRLLRRRGRERDIALVALSPLLVLEDGVGVHVDAMAALAVAAALLQQDRGRPATAAALLAAGGLFKPAPLVALGPLLATTGRRRALSVAAAAAIVVAGAYGIALLLGLVPVGSFLVFFRKWRFGSPLFGVEGPATAAGAIPPLMIVALVVGLAVALWKGRRSFVAGALWGLATPLVASPVVFPWYLSALVPVLAVRPRAFPLIWTLALPLTYEVMDTYATSGSWRPAVWPLHVIAGAWAVGALVDLSRGRSRQTCGSVSSRGRREAPLPSDRLEPPRQDRVQA